MILETLRTAPDFAVINQEVEKFNSKLMEREQVVAANKMDLPTAQ
jgi:GTP-binding protein